MDCFDNLIGIGRREGSTSESGLFLEDIDITVEDAENIKGVITSSGEELLTNLISFSQIEFIDEFRKRLKQANQGRKVFTPNSILQNGIMGFFKDNLPTLSANAANYRGISVRVEKYPYASFHLGELRLFTQVTGSINVLVYDLIQNKLLDTIAVTTVANEISTQVVNKTYETDKQNMHLAFIYDGANATYKSDLRKNNGCRNCGKRYSTYGCEFQAVEFVQADPITRQNIKQSVGGTAGLSIQYSINCNIEPFICSIKNQLASAFLYFVGARFTRKIISSKRINSTNKIPPEPLNELFAFNQTMYEDKMNTLIDGIKLPSDVCFKCESQVSKLIAVP